MYKGLWRLFLPIDPCGDVHVRCGKLHIVRFKLNVCNLLNYIMMISTSVLKELVCVV